MTTVNRNYSLDILKGFAILTVMADHCHYQLPPVLDYFEVPAFFIISGILLKPGKSFVDFLLNKAKRLVPPYFFYAVLYIALVFPLAHTSISVGGIAQAIMQPANAPLWFLKALFCVFVLWRAIVAVVRRDKVYDVAVFVGLLLVAIASTYIRLPQFCLTAGFTQGVLALPLVWFGYAIFQRVASWCCRYQQADCKSRLVSLSLGLCLLAVCVATVRGEIHFHNGCIGNRYLFYLFVVVVFCSFYLIANAIARFRLLEYIGRESLTLFCVHGIFIKIFECVGIESDVLLFAMVLPASLAFCYALSLLPLAKRCHLT